nr:unnamed protein product [Digitaria exilis]
MRAGPRAATSGAGATGNAQASCVAGGAHRREAALDAHAGTRQHGVYASGGAGCAREREAARHAGEMRSGAQAGSGEQASGGAGRRGQRRQQATICERLEEIHAYDFTRGAATAPTPT